jgi:hypothetical protein
MLDPVETSQNFATTRFLGVVYGLKQHWMSFFLFERSFLLILPFDVPGIL